jgi:hypothetical protein
MSLTRTSIGIKTFLRNEKLFCALQGIRDTMPEVRIIVADCGEHTEDKDGIYADLVRDGHKVIWLDFDAGFGAMSNRIADALNTPYLLIGSDDFEFRPPTVRKGIEKLVEVLDNTDIDIASGRVRGPYEFDLEDRGDVVIEHPIKRLPQGRFQAGEGLWFERCDLTVNYSLIKKHVFEKVRWDEPEPKIGGSEHGMFFLDVKRAGYRVAYVPGVQISEQVGEDSARYKQYRARANNPARPCCDKRGVRKYILGNGKVDYEKIDYPEPLTR